MNFWNCNLSIFVNLWKIKSVIDNDIDRSFLCLLNNILFQLLIIAHVVSFLLEIEVLNVFLEHLFFWQNVVVKSIDVTPLSLWMELFTVLQSKFHIKLILNTCWQNILCNVFNKKLLIFNLRLFFHICIVFLFKLIVPIDCTQNSLVGDHSDVKSNVEANHCKENPRKDVFALNTFIMVIQLVHHQLVTVCHQ